MIIKTTIINDAGVIISEKITHVESAPEKKTRAPRINNGTATSNVAAANTTVTLSANGKRMGRPPKAAAAPAPAPEKKARAKKAVAAKG